MKSLKNIFKKAVQAIAGFLQSAEADRQLVQEAVRQQQIYNHICQIASFLQYELYDLFQNSPYRFLHMVELPEHIRFMGYRAHNGQIIYTYQIFSDPAPNPPILHQLKQQFPNDISQFQQMVVFHMGYQDAVTVYPNIMAGIHMINIKQVGCMVQFDIVTNIAPV